MAGFSTYLAQKLVDHVFRGAAYIPPVGTYLALFVADPTDNNVTANEVVAAWYARQQVTAWSAPVGSGSTTRNSNQITFPAVTNNAVTITHWAIYDAATTGNLLASGAFASSTVLNVNDVFVLNAGDVVLDFV